MSTVRDKLTMEVSRCNRSIDGRVKYYVNIEGMSDFELEQLRSITSGGMDLIITSRRPGFDLSPHHDRFMLDNVTLGQGSLPVRQFSPVTIIPPTLHTHYSTTSWQIHVGQCDIGTGFLTSTSVFTRHYHSTDALYSLLHHIMTDSCWTMWHWERVPYQYVSFHPSLSFHRRSILITPPPKLYM
jgi:hypothetical protein